MSRRVLDRLRRYAAVAVGALLLASCSAAEPEHQPPPLGELVSIDQGELLGATDGSVLRYRGIPYAAAPVGERRWRPPGPAPSWNGTRPATEPGARCPQVAVAPDAPPASGSEDCLSLDVTVPAGTTADDALPVLVWIHGGGFSAGAGSDVDPRRLAEAGPLVVVTVNYRLGMLGFLGLPGLEGSGEFGLLDQQAALHWVQRNIRAFGGDPGSVTLAGESAGADSVCSQLTSPGALGLFHRVIMQSGGCSTANIVDVIRPGTGPAGDTWKTLPLLQAAGDAAATAFGCPEEELGRPPAARFGDRYDSAAVLDCLRTLPAAQLVDGTDYYWSPATGTPTLPRRPSDVVVDRDVRLGTPVLAGTTKDEGTLFTELFYARAGVPLTPAGLDALLAATSGRAAAQAARAYAATDRSPDRAWSDVITDRAYACTGLASYRMLADVGPVYAYEFADASAPSPFVALPPELAGGATHGSDVPYLFDLVAEQPPLSTAQQELAAEMVDRWARFAATGNPNGGAGTPWPQWSGEGQILTMTGAGAGTTVQTSSQFAADHHCDVWGVL
ncbi:carboxylesterase/lipase family protein [Pseudonocardia sp. MH-G8]|uniref:carboxylesterase/lipase family protein n=1 Tax=Pseudonocardia sp. MH-G8 TaxID=1854588 RepID=UPI0013045420|nr:carboxylesterase family protein [Pseudonocardia sp. MH-G8]